MGDLRSISVAVVLLITAASSADVSARGQTRGRVDDVPSMTVPVASTAELGIVQRARRSLNSAQQWNRADSGMCLGQAPTFSVYCALENAAKGSADRTVLAAAQQDARLVVWDIVVSKDYDHPLTGYNNDPATSFEDIERLFRWLETRVHDRLVKPVSAVPQERRDDSQANPPATPHDLAIAREARKLLSSRASWNSHDMRDCPAGAKTFSYYCALVEASDRVLHNMEPRGAAMQEARFVVNTLAVGRNYPHRLMGFNNDPATGYADIQQALQSLEDRLSARLKEGR